MSVEILDFYKKITLELIKLHTKTEKRETSVDTVVPAEKVRQLSEI